MKISEISVSGEHSDWLGPSGLALGQTIEEVARIVAENAIATLQRAKPARTGVTVAGLAQEIRANLALIEKMKNTTDR